MHTETLISFIVPMYKPDITQLEKCLRSICPVRQKFEVILIDDGSEDKILKNFCDSFIREDDRFRYICQKNCGVSAARNQGLLEARGSFVSFVDADDFIDSSVLNNMDFDVLKDAELIVFDINVIDAAGNNSRRVLFPGITGGYIEKKELIGCFVTTPKLCECWGKLFCMDTIKKELITFPYGITQGEDVIFNSAYFKLMTRVYYCSEIFYHYNYAVDNTVQRFINNPLSRLNDILINYKCLLALIEDTFDQTESINYIKSLSDDYISGFGARLVLLSKYKLLNREIRSFIQCEAKPLLYKNKSSIFPKPPKTFVFNLIIKNNMWFAYRILKYFKRA